MSKTVDNRIVEMRFDNKQFESGVATTMSTLEKLKQKLNLSDASKGLENLGRVSKGVDMSGLSAGVDVLHAKFSALQVMGVTALANITNSAINTGKKMVSALTIDPIKTGFNEYETKINAIQTIMSNTASKGTTMSDVTKVIDELNTYADKTIYNFSEMTRNIGTFTAAGVGLEKSASAIKGIANLAAASGSNSQQASTAMYQLSQALATGTVKLMDWNSVVNAGMGGEKFQNALKATAREHGVAIDEIIESQGSFRDSLQKGWLSADILNETLNKFTVDGAQNYAKSMQESGKWTKEQADALIKEANAMEDAATKVKTFTQLWDTMKESAQSGWGKTWELIIGDFEGAKELLTSFSDKFGKIIGDSADSRNNLLEGALGSKWGKLTGQLAKAGISTDELQNKIKELAKTHNVNLDEMIEKEGSFEKALQKAFKDGKLDKSVLSDTVKSFIGNITGATKATDTAAGSMEKYGEIVNKVISGDFGSGKERIEALTKAGYDYATVQNLVNEKLGSSVRHLSSLSEEQLKNADSTSRLSDEQLKSKGYTEEQIIALRDLADASSEAGMSIEELINNIDKPSGRELIWESINIVLDSMTRSLSAVGKAWREVFPKMKPERLYGMIEALNGFAQNLKLSEDNAKNITRTFRGLFAIIDIITTIVGGGLKLGFTLLNKVLGAFDMNVLDLTGNMGDLIFNFRNWLLETNAVARGVDWLIGKIPGAITLIEGWVDSFMALPQVQTAIEKLKNSFNDMLEVGRNIIEGLKNGLRDGITSIPDILVEIGKKLLSAIKGVLGIHSPSTEMEEVGGNVIEGLLNGLKNKAIGVWEFMKKLGSKMVESFTDMDWSKLFAVGSTVALVVIVKKIADTLGALASPFQGFGDLMSGVGGVLEDSSKQIKKVIKNFAKIEKSFSKILNGIALSFKADAAKKFAIAVAILAGAVIALTFVDPKKLWNAVGVITALALVLGGLVIAIDKLVKTTGNLKSDVGNALGLGSLSTLLIGIGAAILLVGITVKLIADLDPERAKAGFEGLAIVFAAVAATLVASGIAMRIAGSAASSIKQLGKVLVKLSITMLLMIGVVKLASKVTEDEWILGAKAMGGFAVFIGAVAIAARIAGSNMASIHRLGGMLLKLSISMLLMIGVVKLANQLTEAEMIQGAKIMAGFTAFVLAMSIVARVAGGNEIPKMGGLLLAMTTSLLILAGVAKIIATMSWGDIGKAAVGIVGFTAILYAMVMMVKKVGPDAPKLAGTLIAMSIAVGILAAVALVLSLISIPGLTKGIIAVGLLGGVMTAMIWATRGASDVKGNLIAMTVAIGIMAASVAALSMIDGSKLFGSTVALSVLMGMFALIAKSSGAMGKSMGSLIVMTSAIAVLGGVVYLLAQLDLDSVVGVSASLSMLLLSLSASMLLIGKAGLVASTSLIALGVMTLVIGGLALIIGLLAKSDVGSTLGIALSLSTLILALSVSVAILAAVGPAATGALVGIGVMAALIAGVGGIMVALGALVEHFPSMETFLDKGIGILEKIGYGLGSFLGNIIGGFSAGVTSGLPEIAMNLSTFMMGLQPFIIGAKMIDDKALTGVSSLAKMMVLLAGANILEGISKWATGKSSMETFAVGLDSFADAIVAFSNKVKGKIDDESVTAAANAGLMMAKMQTMIQGSDGIVQWFAGEKNLADFGTQLVAFGSAITAFSDEVKGKVDSEAVTAAANAGTLMAELQSKVQPSKGIIQWFAGEKNFAIFGTQLVAFGSAITSFSESVSGDGKINEEAITAAANAGTIMSTMQSKLVGTDGVVQWFTGEKNMSTLGAQLVLFGDAIVAFSDTVGSDGAINEEAITAAANAGTLMSELQSNIDPIGGVLDFFTGKQDLAIFGSQIVLFGQAIANFSKEVTGKIDEESVTAAANAGLMLAKIQKAIPSNKILDGKISIDDFGKKIVKFGEHMVRYSEKVTGINTGAISTATESANGLVKLIKSLANIDPSGIENFKVNAIGTAMKGYAEKVSGIDAGVVASSVSSALKLMSLVRSAVDLDASGVHNFRIIPIGQSLSAYSDLVSGINTTGISSSISSIKKLVDVIVSMSGIDSSGVSSFVKAVNSLGKVSLDSISKSFSGSSAKLTNIGSSIITGLSNGMKSKQSLMISTVQLMITTMQSSIIGKASAFKTAGTTLITNLVAGISSQTPKISNSLVTAISSAATSIKGQYSTLSSAGSYLAEGFANGIALKAYLSKNKAKAMAKAAADAINEVLEINSPSRVTRASGEGMGEGMEEGIENSTGTVVESARRMGAKSADALASSLLDESGNTIANFDKIKDGLITSLKDSQTKTDAVKARNIASEKAYWENLLKTRQNGVDAAQYKGMTLVQFEEDILKQSTDVWDNYINEMDSKTDSIMNQRNLFDALPEKEAVGKDELMDNLSAQVDEYGKFADTLADLNGRVEDQGLKDFINTLGIDSMSQLEAINSMTDTELTKYADLYQQKYALAKTSALTQIDSLKLETEAKLSNLFGGVSVDAASFGTSFDGTMDSLNQYVQTSLLKDEMANNIGVALAEGVGGGIVKALQAPVSAAGDMITSTLEAAKKAADINSPSKLFEQEIGVRLAEGVASGMSGMLSEIVNIVNGMVDDSITRFGDSYVKFVDIGAYVAEGFKEGILSKAEEISEAAAEIARSAMEAVENELDINSPSRKMYKLGGFTGKGFVNGLKAYADRSYKAGVEMADSTRKGLNKAIAKVYDIVNGDMDMQPTIRPVLDLGSIEAGVGRLDGLLGNSHAIGIAANVDAINSPRNQNGGFQDVILAINKLGKEISSKESNSYSLNGITYDDGSNVSDAIKSLVRAAKIERRT